MKDKLKQIERIGYLQEVGAKKLKAVTTTASTHEFTFEIKPDDPVIPDHIFSDLFKQLNGR